MATIIPLSEGSFTIGKDKIFHPFNQEKDDLQARTTGSLLVEVQPFCIVTERDVLLIDTGLGFSQQGELQIHRNLKANGIQPTDVTKVLMSHLHKDHAGGVSYKDRLGNAHLAFPNATYFVQRREYDFAEATGYPSFITDEFEVFDRHPRVFWLHDDEGSIDNYIHYQVTGAHSPYHQVFWIETAEGLIFFGGDDAPQHKQMLSRFVAKYDHDGKKCMELRQQWWDKGSADGWTFLFYHDISHPYLKA
ncbi:MAG: MBL fold metallo-hydrolase [Chitinophagaceae bacterium]|nr:MBL fold metallo-hydrolase [Chitinophagaceae bacterium]